MQERTHYPVVKYRNAITPLSGCPSKYRGQFFADPGRVMLRAQLRKVLALVACVLIVGAPATAATLNLCWTGAGGYTMTGRMTLPDTAMAKAVVTEADVTKFKIAGYLNGALLGTWDMADRTAQTTWFLRFEPATMTFPTGDMFATENSQGWNADGGVTNCGNPGFGFNSGGFAQDVCVDGVYQTDSSIDPLTPLVATTTPVTPTCGASPTLSKSAPRAR